MDERLLDHYNNELHHLREMAGEFAREFPKIAGRLSLDKDAKEICPDPYVERLLEGFAYLAARILYIPAYALGWSPWRSLIWSVGLLATIVMLLAALL